MINSVKSWFAKPYPLISDIRTELAIISITSMAVVLILVVFKPFGLHVVHNVTYLAGFGICTFVSLAIYFFLLPRIFPIFFNEDRWTIGRETSCIMSSLFLIAFTNYLYNTTIGVNIAPQWHFLQFVFMTIAVGVFPLLLMIYLTEKLAKRSHDNQASKINSKLTLKETEELDSTIVLISNNKSDPKFEVKLDDFIVAQSTGNYVEISYQDESDEVQKHLLRITLTELQTQLGDDESFVRCHKSYIINRQKINKVEGNARSCIAIMDQELKIPISRTLDRSLLTQ